MPKRPDAASPLLTLIDQLYAAPGTLDGWQSFLASVTTVFNGTAATLISHRLDAQVGSITADAGFDPEVRHLYDVHWGARDPWALSPRRSAMTAGAVMRGEYLVSSDDLQRTDFYNDFARHWDIESALVGVLERGPSALSVLSINRGERRATFATRDEQLLGQLVPHVQRAIQMHRRLVAADLVRDGLAGALHALSRPTLLLGEGGRVLFMNPAAEELLAAKDGLTAHDGELRASAHDDTVTLRRACTAAATTFEKPGAAPGGAFVVGRPSGKRPLAVLVCPLPGSSTLRREVERAVAVVFISDFEQEGLEASSLRALFDLTPREAELVTLLVGGLTLAAAADRLGLRRETVRSRVKDIFAKTGTHRQSELVRLVMSVGRRG